MTLEFALVDLAVITDTILVLECVSFYDFHGLNVSNRY